MASVSSLDRDMRNIRLSKYTPQAANEVRTWIEGILGEPLAPGDVLDALKDGTALCKLINLAAPSSNVRFKASSMPFVQMENISHFLRACQQPPISLHSHDIFQTVDLYESKDPAQVLQCIAAFSRQAHATQPTRFPTALGGAKARGGSVTPQSTGGSASAGTTPRQYGRVRGSSNTSETSSATSYATSQASSQAIGGRGSPARGFETASPQSNGTSATSSSGGVSSWSKRQDEGATTPAWNIHQYGYMGGASQGNQGIMFGGRRQITSPAPKVPSLAEKERKRKEQESEAERLRIQAEEAEHKRRVEREAEEERDRAAEERRWEEETRKQREAERLKVEEEKRRWEAEERRWKEEEQNRLKEEREAESKLKQERQQPPDNTRPPLQGQFLSQYQAEQQRKPSAEESERAAERARVKELERQLEEAKEREAKYERERQERLLADSQHGLPPSSHHVEEERHPRPISIQRSTPSSIPYGSDMTHHDDENERSLLKQAWQATNSSTTTTAATATETPPPPPQPPRPLPSPQLTSPPLQPPRPQKSSPPPPLLPTRPLPNPATYASASPPPPPPSEPPSPPPTTPPSPSPTRKSPFTRPAKSSLPASPSTSSQIASPTTTTAHPSSLLARERDLTLARQAEWAAAQESTASAAATFDPAARAASAVGPEGEGWDVHQYGYLGGDSQNRGDVGIGLGGGGRRQLVGADPGAGKRVGGPREMPR